MVLIIGKTEGHIDQSLFARTILDEKNGPPPEINLFNEKNNGMSLLSLMEKDFIKSAHDVSLGGIITALSKMSLKGSKGIELKKPKKIIGEIEYLFAEDQGRYIIEINPKDYKEVVKILDKNSVHHEELGIIIDNEIIINEKTKVTIDELKSYNTNWLINYMNS
jgi:phosphoribosylformylglycinamidine synthase